MRADIERRTNRAIARVWKEPAGNVQYFPTGVGPAITFDAIFDSDGVRWGEDEGAAIRGRTPVLDVETSQLAAPEKGDEYTIGGARFRVVFVEETANSYRKLHSVKI